MFFERDAISVEIIDVVKLSQKNINWLTKPREFCALSYRFRAESKLIANEKEYEMKSGSLSFIPAGMGYTRISIFEELVAIHFNIIGDFDRQMETLTVTNLAKFEELFNEIYNIWCSRESGYRYRAQAILYEILAECRKSKAHNRSVIEPSVEYLKKNYERSSLTIHEIAEQSGISEVYFRKLFKSEYGMSPQKYIIKLRIEKAIRLLRAGYQSLAEIAAQCGYRDYKYFLTEFKRYIGVTPTAYIKG